MTERGPKPCSELEVDLAAAIAGELSAGERRDLDAHLATCPRCAAEAASWRELWKGLGRLPEEAPSPFLEARFERMLRREIEVAGGGRAALEPRTRPATVESPSELRRLIGLAAVLAVGIALGVVVARDRSSGGELERLRSEVGSLHELVAVSMLRQSSASERLQGVAYGRDLTGSDARVVDALLETLSTDSNVNVRLAALDALFGGDVDPTAAAPAREMSRRRVLAAALAQDSPLVQLTAIDRLLELGSTAAIRDLEQLLERSDLDPTVASYLRDRLGRKA